MKSSPSSSVVLVVDDEPDFLEFVTWRLSKRGYHVLTKSSASSALSVIEEEGPDVLVADIRMPDMDGLELIRVSMEKQEDLQCIVVTGHGGIESAIEAMRIGAVNYLTKPVSTDELDVAIQKALEKLALIRKVREKQVRLEEANLELMALREQLEENLKKEKTEKKEVQKELHAIRLRECIASVMMLSIRCWKQATGKSKIDLAEESHIWTAVVDKNGTYRTRTLDKYLKTASIPPNPRVNDVLDTGYFVLSRMKTPMERKWKLESQLEELETLYRNAP